MAGYNLQVEMLSTKMGSSPSQQVVDYVRKHEGNYKKDVRIQNLPKIRQGN